MSALESLNPQAEKLVAKYDQKKAATLMLLHLAQDKVGSVTPEVEAWVAGWVGVPVVHVKGVVTFYSMYHQKPVGRHHIRVCTSTSCWLGGCEKNLSYIKKKLGVENGGVTADGKFSLEEAECLCACEKAPMMEVNGKYSDALDEKAIDTILDGLK